MIWGFKGVVNVEFNYCGNYCERNDLKEVTYIDLFATNDVLINDIYISNSAFS